jgi:ABC-type Fe3+ transport system substrate-binding protein
MKDHGMLGKYESRESKYLMKEALDADGFWVGGDIDVLVTGFNTKLISRSEVPTTYDGLLDGTGRSPCWASFLMYAMPKGLIADLGQKR